MAMGSSFAGPKASMMSLARFNLVSSARRRMSAISVSDNFSATAFEIFTFRFLQLAHFSRLETFFFIQAFSRTLIA